MAQLKDTVVNGTLTANTIKRSDGSSDILKGDGSTIAQSSIAAGSATKATQDANGKVIADTYATKSSLGNAATKNVGTTSGTVAAGDHTHEYNDLTGLFPWMRKSITLDSIVLDGTTLTNVEFENVGNGIFLSKYMLKRRSMDELLTGSPTNDVGNGNIGKAAATSIEASLRRQFGDSVNLKTYVRTYDGATHSEKVFLPLECEVYGLIKWSADKDTLGKYQQWSIPNYKIKKEINDTSITLSWWCANKSSEDYGRFCFVNYNGDPEDSYSGNGVVGVALAFYI